jgi:sortase A
MSHALTATQPPHQVKARLLYVAYLVFLSGGVLALLYAGATVAESYLYQATAGARLEELTSSAPPASLPAAAPAIVSEGNVLGQLEIPSLGMKVIVDEGVSNRVLRRAVGHVPQTALPGQWGNIVLAGHRDTFFRPLRKIQAGDAIALKTPTGNFEFRVESTVVTAPTDVQLMKPTEDRMLTLVTCFPFYYVGPAPKRFIVRARLVDSPPHPGHQDAGSGLKH